MLQTSSLGSCSRKMAHVLHHMQKPDWTKDFTEAEVEEMRRGDWDVEDVDLDPIATRYVQPALKLNVSAHDRVLAEATEASRLADAYNKGEKVRCI